LDRWLATDRNTGLSRNRLQRLIEQGRVLVNGKAEKPSLKLKAGDRVSVSVPPRRRTSLVAEAQPLVVVYEDEHVLVLDKPAGLVVHPGAGVQSGTLVNALLHHAPDVATVGGEGRPGIVHRLDRDTTGLLVVAAPSRPTIFGRALRARDRVYR
jgi:23S rRNA pseudouridine1911/1915/1917 synthase